MKVIENITITENSDNLRHCEQPCDGTNIQDLNRENPASHIYFSQRLRLHFLDWGNSNAEHVLLVHGIHDHCHAWDWTARHLCDRYHIVAPDLRGHGDSEWSKGGNYSLLDHVYDLAQLVDQQKLEPLKVISHSLGGTIAALLAGSYPDLIEKLVIVEGVGLYPMRGYFAPEHRIKEWVRSNLSLAGRIPRRYGTLEEAVNRMQQQNPHLDEAQARHLTIHGTHQNEDGSFMWKFDNYTRLSSPYDIAQDDIRAVWECIKCPVLIINSDRGYPHRIGQDDTLQHFNDVHLEVIDNASHWTHHDQLRHFLRLVDEFLVAPANNRAQASSG